MFPLIPPLPVYTDILPCIRAQRTVPRLNHLGAILIRESSLPRSIAPLWTMIPIPCVSYKTVTMSSTAKTLRGRPLARGSLLELPTKPNPKRLALARVLSSGAKSGGCGLIIYLFSNIAIKIKIEILYSP